MSEYDVGANRLHPEHGWIAVALPAAARRLRVSDPSLAAMLKSAGANVDASDPDVDIGPAETIAGDAPLAIVPIDSLGPLEGRQPWRLARRATAAMTVRARAQQARSCLRRRGYEKTNVLSWDVEQVLRLPGFQPQRLRAVEYLPRAAVVTGYRADSGPSLLDAVISAAGRQLGEPVAASAPYVTASGTLLLFTPAHVVRVAIGPGRHHLDQHRAALAQLAALDPPPIVADCMPTVVAFGEVGLASWVLEERLPGTVPDTVDDGLVGAGVDYLVALHGCCRGGDREPLVRAAETVAALSGAPVAPLVRLAEQLDAELTTVPRGFGHGDFWRKNLLVENGRLRGVVDWERAGGGRLPLLDLLQLTFTRPPHDRQPFGAMVADTLLAWARNDGDAAARRYCAELGLEASPRLLRSLVLAYWLDRLARELEKCGDKGGTASWLAGNIEPVLAVAEVAD